MPIKKVTGAKKEFLDLLLLADEQENMIDQYLERGEMFVWDEQGIKAELPTKRLWKKPHQFYL